MDHGKVLFRSKVAANWDLEPKVEGRVIGFETIDIDKRKTRVMLVEQEGQITQVFEASQLEELFSHAKVGHHVAIEYRGTKDIKGGKRVRLFASTLYSGEGGADGETSPRRKTR